MHSTEFTVALQVIPAACYCSFFNLLDYPAGVVTVGRVTETDVRACKKDYDGKRDRWARLIKEANATEDAVGLPIGNVAFSRAHKRIIFRCAMCGETSR